MSYVCDECKRTFYNDHLTGVLMAGRNLYCFECANKLFHKERDKQ